MAAHGVAKLGRPLAAAALLLSAPATGFEFLDGNLRLNGFAEQQIRAIANDLDTGDGLDLAQSYSILNLELEWQIAPSGWGPFSLLALFGRAEGRYDCMWNRCGVFPSIDTYGDRASHLPKRLIDAHRSGYTGTIFTGDTRRFAGVPADQLDFAFKDDPYGDAHRPLQLFQLPGFSSFFGFGGPDGQAGTADDPARSLFDDIFRNCIFAARQTPGPEGGGAAETLGPWNPRCRIRPIGKLRDQPNPFRGADDAFGQPRADGGDPNPVLVGIADPPVGSGELPFRRAPDFANTAAAPGPAAQGIFYPTPALARRIDDHAFDSFDQNFRQAELEWNRGASQQDEKELKEVYLDVELLQGDLWLRLGKQNIVWGKTELFRTTDQFNPQDLAISTLPTLEESRIALWALRAAYSFYDVGPFQDVKLEGAFNFDQFEPNDVGRCGEPFALPPVCARKAYGLFAHGLTGVGVAGEIRPPDPWDDLQGVEGGVRLEFRWQRFSFALADFYGFSDSAFADSLGLYERNVDPQSGMPRRFGATGACDDPADAACLSAADALAQHPANQTLFALLCANSVGFIDLDLASCAENVFNSNALTDPANPIFSTRVVVALSSLLAGDQNVGGFGTVLESLVPGLALGVDLTVDLTRQPDDGPFLTLSQTPYGPVEPITNLLLAVGLDGFLTDQQEALLGCGPFYGTSCDGARSVGGVVTNGGIDFLNAEASALVQSFVGFEGTMGDWSATDAALLQPGTVGFDGGPVCTRPGGSILPGCRGPGDAGYDVSLDGDPAGQLHPLTGQPFRTELASLSWNLQVTLVAASTPPDQDGDGVPDRAPRIDDLDASDPLREDGCSFAKPQLCRSVQGFLAQTGVTRSTRRAGGNGEFGRRDFIWHGGGAAVLRYQKRNVLGFSMDFAEDVTRTNWALETTWIEGEPFADNDASDGLTEVDTYNLTVSLDRPTLVNFLNRGRSFFVNSQWFIQYVDGYRRGFPSNGPWNALATLTVSTGYFQDRLIPSVTGIYDFRSNSGAGLFEFTYRPSQAFSFSVGTSLFFGRFEPRVAPLADFGLPPNRVGSGRDRQYVENALSVAHDLDQLFLKIRYAF